jgi:hypothetical protein
MQDRANPHAREQAFEIARRDPPAGLTVTEAIAAIGEVLEGIGDTCPESSRPRSVTTSTFARLQLGVKIRLRLQCPMPLARRG